MRSLRSASSVPMALICSVSMSEDGGRANGEFSHARTAPEGGWGWRAVTVASGPFRRGSSPVTSRALGWPLAAHRSRLWNCIVRACRHWSSEAAWGQPAAPRVRRSALRADCPAMLGLLARRPTRSAHFVRCARTPAASQLWRRAARAARIPALLGASHGRCALPPRGFATGRWCTDRWHATVGGLRARRYPLPAMCEAPSSAASGSARTQCAPPQLTRRRCPNGASAASEVSWAARPRSEQRRGATAAGGGRGTLSRQPVPRGAMRSRRHAWP